MERISTYCRKDGRWECRVILSAEGKKRSYRSFYGKTKEQAEQKAAGFYKTQSEAVEEAALTQITVGELTEEWLLSNIPRIKASTAANYRMKAQKHILPAFGKRQCSALKSKDISAFIQDKLDSGLSPRYVSDIIVLFRSIFRYAQREYNIRNVLDGIKLPKKTKPEVRILDSREQKILERYIEKNKTLATLGIALSMYMGLRIGELCALKWQDIDLEKRILTVSRTIQRIQTQNSKAKTMLVITEPKTASSKRSIPIPECAARALKLFRDRPDRYVLSGSEKPVEPRTMQYRFARILKNADLPSVHFHSLRHLFATNCIALGFDVKTLSELLGHSSVEITLNRYVHSSMERKRACMELIKPAA